MYWLASLEMSGETGSDLLKSIENCVYQPIKNLKMVILPSLELIKSLDTE